MRTLPLLLALSAFAPAILGQANCSAGTGSPVSIATQTPFAGNNFYGHPNFPAAAGPGYTGFSFLFDVTITNQIDITQIDIDLFDNGGAISGGGNIPNQVGNTTNVELYIFPGFTWTGNETNPAVWGLLGTGTLTVAAQHQHSQAIFTAPITLPPGLHGLAFKVDQTTTGINPGPLHPLIDPNASVPPLPTGPYIGPAMTITNLVFNRESWTASLTPTTHIQNLEVHYTLPASQAAWTSFGTGCVQPNAPIFQPLARPIIGNSIVLRTSNIQPGTLLNFLMFGFTPDVNGLSLAPYGLPGCSLYLQFGSTIITNVFPVNNGVSTALLQIPSVPSLLGLVVYGQAAPATSGSNAGFYLSNAICMAAGLQ